MNMMRGMVVDQFLRWAEDIKVSDDPEVASLLEAVSLTDDPALIEKARQVLQTRQQQKRSSGVPFKQHAKQVMTTDDKNLVTLGTRAETNEPFSWPLGLLNCNAVVNGIIRAGKTTLARNLAIAASKKVVVWFITYEKQGDWWDLLRHIPNLVFYDQDNFPYNVWAPPPGVRWQYHATEMASTFAVEHELFANGSGNVMQRAVFDCFREHSGPGAPHLPKIAAKIESYPTTGDHSLATLKGNLRHRIAADLRTNPHLHSIQKGLSVAELARNHMVLELQGMSQSQARTLVMGLLIAVFTWRMATHQRRNTLEHLIIIDEAAALLPARGINGEGFTEGIGFSSIARILSKTAETGLGLLISAQSPGSIDQSAYKHSWLKIAFNVGSGRDMLAIQEHMALDRRQLQWIPRMPQGQAIVHTVIDEEPFIVNFNKPA